jgi:hypothetical protein
MCVGTVVDNDNEQYSMVGKQREKGRNLRGTSHNQEQEEEEEEEEEEEKKHQ